MMKSRLLFVVLSAAALVGCGEDESQIESKPPTEQKVVMVPAVGGGAQQNANGQPAPSNAPAPNPNSTPDTVKQPGDK